jgi:hypothetical protein
MARRLMDMPAPADMMATAQPVAPPMAAPVTHDVTVVTTKKGIKSRVMGVPPEEFGIERNARDIKTCNYCFHEVNTKTEADVTASMRVQAAATLTRQPAL